MLTYIFYVLITFESLWYDLRGWLRVKKPVIYIAIYPCPDTETSLDKRTNAEPEVNDDTYPEHIAVSGEAVSVKADVTHFVGGRNGKHAQRVLFSLPCQGGRVQQLCLLSATDGSHNHCMHNTHATKQNWSDKWHVCAHACTHRHRTKLNTSLCGGGAKLLSHLLPRALWVVGHILLPNTHKRRKAEYSTNIHWTNSLPWVTPAQYGTGRAPKDHSAQAEIIISWQQTFAAWLVKWLLLLLQ